MKYVVAGVLVVSLLSTLVFSQTKNQRAKHDAQTKTLKICQGVPIPDGYIIVAQENLASCPHGAYVLKKDDGPAINTTPASRPRTVGNTTVDSVVLNPPQEISNV